MRTNDLRAQPMTIPHSTLCVTECVFAAKPAAGADLGGTGIQVARHLAMWVAWQHAWSADDELGYPKQSPMFSGAQGGAVSPDTFDHLCEQADAWVARAMDAIIDDLPPIERAAIYHLHLCAVFRGRDLDAAYAAALEHLGMAMAAKGLLLL